MNPEFIYIDLFCGAGGTTSGLKLAVNEHGQLIAIVAAAVNHDPVAIKSHHANSPEVEHFEEDIRTLDLTRLRRLINMYRAFYPNAKIVLWASLECTNFSKAKGGMPRDADSRTLAEHLFRYVIALNPDYIQIENVVEFMSWGPLESVTEKTEEGYLCCPVTFFPVYSSDDNSDEGDDDNKVQIGWRASFKGKPISKKNGKDWLKWREKMCSFGYRDEWHEMNSANFGAYTSRNRLFGIFARPGLPIVWPEPTHAKKVTTNSLFGNLKPWKPVKEVLDFEDEGKSIFDRKKPLVEKSLERIYAGLIKFVAGGKDKFILKYNSVSKNGVHHPPSIDDPCPTIACQNRLGIVTSTFIAKNYSGKPEGKVIGVDGPAGTITSIDSQSLVNAQFLVQRNSGKPDSKLVSVESPARTLTGTGGNQDVVSAKFLHAYYGNGDNNHSVFSPAPTLPTKDRCAIISTVPFIQRAFSGGGQLSSVDQPAGSILNVPKLDLVQAFLMHTNYSNQPTSIEDAAPVITANRKWSYVVNPSWFGHPSPTDGPCPTIVARQDKSPLYLVVTEQGELAIEIYDTDSPMTRKIKEFMALYGIIDIKMRMLKVSELLKIQGFPDGYILEGSQEDQKKFIGNSVVPHVVRAWTEALYQKSKFIRLEGGTVEAVAA